MHATIGPDNSPVPPPSVITAADVADRWLDLRMFDAQPLGERLSGLELEYRIIQLYSGTHLSAPHRGGVHRGTLTVIWGERADFVLRIGSTVSIRSCCRAPAANPRAP
ncbi:MAG: hypothetical protein ACREIV_03955 [Planctomycetaceae bacterium]